ncbi:MAG: DUF4157 domain-containing protein [Deltaproteobacteria bacterium]|nr:DUF4157 domain-containing protein [Deltaproteobacteria bacterium]
MSQHETETPTQAPAPADRSSGGGGGGAPAAPSSRNRELRRLSYKDGAAALDPRSGDAQAIADKGLSGPGTPVASSAAARFEKSTGQDVSGTKEHTGPEAQEACAALGGGVKGFSMGGEVAYASSRPAEHVQMHELAHVAQDRGGSASAGGVQAYGGGGDLEGNADQVASAVVGGQTATVAGGKTGLAFFKEGDDKTLEADPGNGDPGNIDAKNDNPNGDPPGDGDTDKDKKEDKKPKSEAEQVAETHSLTLQRLKQDLVDLRKNQQRIFNFRKEKNAANDAKSIFTLLSQYDSLTITTAWQAVMGEVPGEFDKLIDAIGYKDAARTFPREARATLAACPPGRLETFAEGVVKKNPFAAELAVGVMPKATQDVFTAKHPELATAKKVTDKDREALDAEQMSLKDDALRKQEEERRKGVEKAGEEEGKKKEIVDKTLATDAAKTFVDKVTAFITGGKFVEALVELGQQGDEAIFLAAVRALDGASQIATMFRGLTFDEKWNTHPVPLKKVLAARTADKNLEAARELLDITHYPTVEKADKKGKVKKEKRSAISSEDAYAAYHLLKGLPAAHRELFQKTYPGLVTAMEMHLNKSMREADDTNMVGAGGGDQELQAQMGQKIADDALWAEPTPVDQLSLTLKMAVKSGQRDAIGKKLMAMKTAGTLTALYADGARKAAVEGALGVTGDLAKTPEGVTPDAHWLSCLQLQKTVSSKDESLDHMTIFGKGGAVRALRHANKETREENKADRKKWTDAKKNGEEVGEKPDKKNPTLIGQIFNALGKKPLDVENLRLDEAQANIDTFAYGGDLEFAKSSKDDKKNRANIHFDQNQGVMDFTCNDLQLNRIRYPMGDMVVETGPCSMSGLELHVTWPTPHNPGQTSAIHVVAKGLAIGDVMVTSPGSVMGIGKIDASDIVFDMREEKIDFGDNPDSGAALKMLTQYNPARSIITFGLQSYKSKPQANDNIAALTQAFSGKPAGAQGGMNLHVGSINATGIAVGADTFVKKASIEGIDMVWDSRPSVTGAARIAQLEKMVKQAQTDMGLIPADATGEAELHKRTRLEGQIGKWTSERADIEKKIPGWQALEKVYQEIYEHQKLNGPKAGQSEDAVNAIRQKAVAAGIVGADAMDLGQLAVIVKQQLTSESGIVTSVGKMEAEGIDAGGTHVDKATVTGVNVVGKGETFGEAVDPKLAKRLGVEDGQTKEGKAVGSSSSLDIAGVEVQGVVVGGSSPKLEDLRKTKAKLVELRDAVGKLRERDPKTLNKDEAAALAKDGKELDAIELQWKKEIGAETYGSVVDAMLSFADQHKEDEIKKSADLLGQWKAFEKKLASEPTTVEQIKISGIAASGTTSTVKGPDGTTTTKNTVSASVGEIEGKGIQSGDNSVGSLSATGISAAGQSETTTKADGSSTTSGSAGFSVGSLGAKDVKAGGMSASDVSVKGLNGGGGYDASKDAAGKTTSQSASGSVSLGSVTGTNVDMGNGQTFSKAGVDNVTLGFDANSKSSEVCLNVGKVYAVGVEMQRGIDAAGKRKTSLEAQIAQAKKDKKDTSKLVDELAKLEQSLKGYRDAHAEQDLVLGEVKAIDTRIEAAQKRLDAAQKEAAVFKHRVKRSDEEAVQKADQQRIESIQKELEGLQKERAIASAKLTKPQGIIASFETEVGLSGEASVSNIDLHLSGLPGLEQLTSKDPDLSSEVKMSLGVGAVAIPTVDYTTPGMSIHMTSASTEKVVAEARVKIGKKPAIGGKAQGYEVQSIDLDSLEIPNITGNGLRITMPSEGELIEIELPKATIDGISLKGVHLDGLDPKSLETATGSLDIKKIETSLAAKTGKSMSANGHLAVTGIHAKALSSGALKFGIDDITLDQLGFAQTTTDKDKKDKKGNSIVTQIVKLGGKANKLGKIKVEGEYDRVGKALTTTVGIGDLDLQNIAYAGGGTSLSVGRATLKTASVTVKAAFKNGEVKPGESSLESLSISELKVDKLAGSGIYYKGGGVQRERFQDGTEKTHKVEQAVSLKSGNLHNLRVTNIQLVGDQLGAMGVHLGSGTVEGLALAMKQDGKNVLQANVSAVVSNVDASLIDDDLTLDIGKIGGANGKGADVKVSMGEGDKQMNVGLEGVTAGKTHVGVQNMGKQDQSIDARIASVDAKKLAFQQGVKNSGYGAAHALGNASLKDIHFQSDHDKMVVDIGSGVGKLEGTVKAEGTTTGTYDKDNPDAHKNDEFVVPRYKVTYTALKAGNPNGFLRMLYPDGSQFTRVNFVDGALKLDLQENIDRLWGAWADRFKGYDKWYHKVWEYFRKFLHDPKALLWEAIFRGMEYGFNNWGESVLGDWANIETGILSTLNGSPKTSLVEAKEGSFVSFQKTLNTTLDDYVKPAVEKVCDYGLVYDAVQGEWGRAAKTTGTWLLGKAGDFYEWCTGNDTRVNDWSEEKMGEYRAQREAELYDMIKLGIDYMLGWGVDMDVHSCDGRYKGEKEPMLAQDSDKGGKRKFLETGLDVSAKGKGTVGGMAINASASLNGLTYEDAGVKASVDNLTIGANAKGGMSGEWTKNRNEAQVGKVELGAGGDVWIAFDKLHFEQDKNYVDGGVAGTKTSHEQYKMHGNSQTGDGPVTNGGNVTYDAGQYAHDAKNGNGVLGKEYTEELSYGQTATKYGGMVGIDALGFTTGGGLGLETASLVTTGQTLGTNWAQNYEKTTVDAKNAEVYGKYEKKYQADQKKKAGS